MSITSIPTLSSSIPSLKISLSKPTSYYHLSIRPHSQSNRFSSSPTKFVPLSSHRTTKNLPGFSQKIYGFFSVRKFSFVCASSDNGLDQTDNGEIGESTMTKRFRYLTKEAPNPPVRWPWFLALAFLIYAWRALFFDLSNWKKGILNIF